MEQAPAIQDQLGLENHCFGCGPDNPEGLRLKSFARGEEYVAHWGGRASMTAGPKHILNGGIIATIIDCHSVCSALADAYRREGRAIGSDPLFWYVTASLHVHYRKPTPLAGPIVLRSRVASVSGKRTTVSCQLLAGDEERVRGEVVAVRVPLSWRA